MKQLFKRSWMGLKNFITYSGLKLPTWNHILLWITGTILLSYVTLAEFRPLWEQYRTNNEMTQTRIVGQNDTIKPPSIAFCMPRLPSSLQSIVRHLEGASRNESIDCPYCVKMVDHSWDVWSELNTSALEGIEEYEDAVQQAVMEKLFGLDDDTFEVLSVNNTDWNLPIVESVWHFFASLTHFDAVNPDNETNYADLLLDFALADKERTQNLFARFASVLCEHISYENSRVSAAEIREGCVEFLVSTPSVIFADGFCFLFPMKDKDGGTLITVDANSASHGVWPALNVSGDNTFDVYADTSIITWPTGDNGKNDAVYMSESVTNASLTEYVGMKYVINMVVEGKKGGDCYQESTPSVCIGNCMVEKIVELCRCVPFTFRNAIDASRMSNLSYCNSSSYFECGMNLTDETGHCEDACANPCEYISYQWHVTRVLYYQNNWRRFRMNVAPVESPYIQFNKTVRETPEQFVSRVAAICNLYLGFSGLSAVAIIVYISDLIKNWWTWKRRIGPSAVDHGENGTEPIALIDSGGVNLHLHEMQRELDGMAKRLKELKHFQHYQYLKQQAQMQKSISRLSEVFKAEMERTRTTQRALLELVRVKSTGGKGMGDHLQGKRLRRLKSIADISSGPNGIVMISKL